MDFPETKFIENRWCVYMDNAAMRMTLKKMNLDKENIGSEPLKGKTSPPDLGDPQAY